MGCGSIRKTLLHLIDAEQWWIGNWNGEAGSFPRSPETMKLQEIETKWRRIRKQRNTFLESVDADRAMDVVVVHPPGPPCKFRVGESAVHVAFHGTHHRAQLLNMIRRSKAKVHNIDFLYAIDQLPKV
jgi:uncharacterized damage-inducible protein DinB